MLRLCRLHLLDTLATRFGLTEEMVLPGTGSPGLMVYRDVLYSPLELSMRNRKELLATLGISKDLEFPYISFVCTNVTLDTNRANLALSRGFGVGEDNPETPESNMSELRMVPFIAEYQIDHFAVTEEDDDAAIRSWLFWWETPYLSFTDLSGRSWKLPIEMVSSVDNSALEDEYDQGSFYRRTFIIRVRAFATRESSIETILSVRWRIYNLDGSVKYTDETEEP